MSNTAADDLALERVFPGESTMAARLRAFAWSTTDLGAPPTWPLNLRVALGICLTAQLPMQIWWGAARTFFYNDACLPLLSATNQPPLGRSGAEAWPEFVTQIGPQIEQVFTTGAANRPVDSRLVFNGEHPQREMDLTFFFSPLLGESGAVEGVFGVCSEQPPLSSKGQQAFLLKLNDALRPLTDPLASQAVAVQILGTHLGVDRCYYAEFDWASDVLYIHHEYTRTGAVSAIGAHPISLFNDLLVHSHTGEPLVCADIMTHPVFGGEAAAYRARGTDAFILIPLVKQGTMVACMCVTMEAARHWSPAEIALVEETAERTWAAVERARAEAALRKSEEKYRTLFNSIDEAFCVIEVLYNSEGIATDWRWLEVNSAYQHQMGIPDPTGKLGSEVAGPEALDDTLNILNKVISTGEPLRFEYYHDETESWYSAYVSRVGDSFSRQAAYVFANITERKQQEQRQAFLLKLSDALRSLSDPVAVQETATRVLGEHLKVNRYFYGEVLGDEDTIVFGLGYANGLPPLAGQTKFSDFDTDMMKTYRAGQTVVIHDLYVDLELTPRAKVAFDAIQVPAAVGVPLVKGGKVRGILSAHQSVPRRWTQSEIALLEETAERTWAAVERARAEEALRVSEQRFRNVLNGMGEAFGLMDHDLRIITQNQEALRLDGRPLEDIRGRTHWEVYPGSEDTELGRLYKHALAEGVPVSLEHRYEWPGGGANWLDMRAYPVPEGLAVFWRDITGRKAAEEALRESEERQAFLLKLSDTLRPIADPVEIMGAASELLGTQLATGRVGYGEVSTTGDGEVDATRTYLTVARDWTNGIMPSAAGVHRFSDFGEEMNATFLRGDIFVLEDALQTFADPAVLKNYEKTGALRASLAVPLLKQGRVVAGVYVQQSPPRKWSETDIRLVSEVAERTWATVERAKAEQALQKSEEKYRTLFNSIDEGFCTFDMLFDDAGVPIDYRFVEYNPAFERHTGLTGAVGRTVRELLPDQDRHWFVIYGRVAMTGEPVRVTRYGEALQRWIEVYAFRIGAPEQRRVAALFSDVTAHKEADLALQANEERQAFLLKLADALRPLTDPGEVQMTAMKLLGEQLAVMRATYFEVDQDQDSFTLTARYEHNAAPIPNRMRLSDFAPEMADAYRAGRTLVFRDTEIETQLGSHPEAYRPIGIRAWAAVPLVKEGQLVAIVGVHSKTPRDWTAAEVRLIEDIAERTWAATERARAEAALRASEARQASILETMAEGVVTIDREGRFFSANAAAERILGVARSELIGQSINTPPYQRFDLDGTPWRDRPLLAEVAAAGQCIFHHDYVIERRDGTRVVVARNITAIHTTAGALLGFVSTLSDITEQKRAETALRDSEERFRTVANLVPDLLWSNDPAGVTEWHNQRWFEYNGQTLEKVAADGWLATVYPDDRALAFHNFQRAIEQVESFRQELRIRSAAGEYRWFLVQANPFKDATGKILRWFGAATDIHEQRMAREMLEQRVQERTYELEELSVSRQQLLERIITAQEDERRRIAHELHDTLGQFLSALNLRLSLLRQSVQLREGTAAPVVEELGQLWQLVNEIDDELRRLTTELRPPILDDLGLEEAIRRYVEAWSQTTTIPVDVYSAGMAGERLAHTLELPIYRIVQEALTNVLKHAQAAAVSVILERRPKELQLIIEDNGVGFDPNASGSQKTGRRALGLIGMQERAALVGGWVDVETAPGVGTTIYVHIPLHMDRKGTDEQITHLARG